MADYGMKMGSKESNTVHRIKERRWLIISKLFSTPTISLGVILLFCTRLLAEDLVATTTPAPKKTIRNISVEVREIFEGDDLNSFLKSANQLKISTQHEVIKQELLFKEGDTFDPFLIEESERNLRSIKYLRQVKIVPIEDGDFVDINVSVQDTWTIIPQLSVSSGTGKDKQSIGLAESDLLGLGKRVEVLYEEDEGRETIEAVGEDRRVWGTHQRLLGGIFQRSDGERGVIHFGRPFRSLVDPNSWSIGADVSDTIGRLFENGDENYIFRQDKTNLAGRYVISRGDPTEKLRRYSFGYEYTDDEFTQADEDDYEDLDLDPSTVSNDPSGLADDRRYSGVALGLESIRPDFISMNYIDRFERVEDYNLGTVLSLDLLLAPEFLGSLDDSLHLSTGASKGFRTGRAAFFRGELGASSRYEDSELANSLVRAEAKYYSVLGPLFAGDYFLGRHTFASSFFVDYGDKLDRDREFSIGADNALRGYDARTFTGDKRFALNVEDRVYLLDDVFELVSIGAAVFAEVGGASDDSFGDLIGNESYSDIGFGLRFGFPRSSGGRILRVDIAFPLRDGPDGSEAGEARIIFSGGQLFDSNLRSENLGSEAANVAVGFDR